MDSASLGTASSSQEKAYAFIKQQIVTSVYGLNQRLNALEIAKLIGVSRTPVKEALGRLEQEGLVRREFGSGYLVRALSVREILDLYKVREALEVEVAREVLPKVNEELINCLASVLTEAELKLRQGLYDEYGALNLRFHNVIAQATENEVLVQALANLNLRVWSVGTVVVSKFRPRCDQILLENRRILNALISREFDALAEAIQAHIRTGGEHVKRLFKDELQSLYFSASPVSNSRSAA